MDYRQLLSAVEEAREKIFSTYRDLHALPEPAFQEKKTSAYIAQRLLKAGYEVKTGLAGGTGLTAVFPRATGPFLGLRADIDALRHQIDGRIVNIHSCGHDAHATMVLSAAEIVKKEYPALAEKIKFLFQPAEEIGQGAKAMYNDGAIDDLSALFGIHLRPAAETKLGTATPDLSHSASISLQFTVTGRAAHSARPHQGINAADAVAVITGCVNAVKPNPLQCATVNVVRLQAGGGSNNIIPESGEVVINIRAENNQLGEELREETVQAVMRGAAAVGATAELTEEKHIPAADNHPTAVEIGKKAITSVLGREGVLDRLVSPGGDDFHYYPLLRKGLKATFIGLGADFKPGLHHPKATFDLEALIIGTKILVMVGWEYLQNEEHFLRQLV